MKFADPLKSDEAMKSVVEMKKNRWVNPGVDYDTILSGNLVLIPEEQRLKGIEKDHNTAVSGGMFFSHPDKFVDIVKRLDMAQANINNYYQSIKHF